MLKKVRKDSGMARQSPKPSIEDRAVRAARIALIRQWVEDGATVDQIRCILGISESAAYREIARAIPKRTRGYPPRY